MRNLGSSTYVNSNSMSQLLLCVCVICIFSCCLGIPKYQDFSEMVFVNSLRLWMRYFSIKYETIIMKISFVLQFKFKKEFNNVHTSIRSGQERPRNSWIWAEWHGGLYHVTKMHSHIIGNKKSGEWMDRESGPNRDPLRPKAKITSYIFIKYSFPYCEWYILLFI